MPILQSRCSIWQQTGKVNHQAQVALFLSALSSGTLMPKMAQTAAAFQLHLHLRPPLNQNRTTGIGEPRTRPDGSPYEQPILRISYALAHAQLEHISRMSQEFGNIYTHEG